MREPKEFAHWVCQRCDQPISEKGSVFIFNADPEQGAVGGYPHGDALDRSLPDGTPVGFRVVTVDDLTPKRARNHFEVVHHSCAEGEYETAYGIAVERAATLEDYIGWILHLCEKRWFGFGDMRRMLMFWWTHRGLRPPS